MFDRSTTTSDVIVKEESYETAGNVPFLPLPVAYFG